MTTKTVCVPRELLMELRNSAHAGSDQFQRRNEQLDELIAGVDALLAQPVSNEPVAWELEVEGYKSVLFDNYQRALSEQEHFQDRGRTSVVHTLCRHPPAPAIPEGYALVPIEPTEAMRDAGNIYSLNRATLMRIWADMLDAAQQPTEGSTDD